MERPGDCEQVRPLLRRDRDNRRVAAFSYLPGATRRVGGTVRRRQHHEPTLAASLDQRLVAVTRIRSELGGRCVALGELGVAVHRATDSVDEVSAVARTDREHPGAQPLEQVAEPGGHHRLGERLGAVLGNEAPLELKHLQVARDGATDGTHCRPAVLEPLHDLRTARSLRLILQPRPLGALAAVSSGAHHAQPGVVGLERLGEHVGGRVGHHCDPAIRSLISNTR